MFYTRERTLYKDEEDAPCTVSYNGTPPHWTPPFALVCTLPFRTPRIERRYEKIRSTKRVGIEHTLREVERTEWKPVEHYVRYLDDQNAQFDPYPTMRWVSQSITAIGNYSGNAKAIIALDQPAFRGAYGVYGSHNLGLPSMTEERPDGGFVPLPIDLPTLASMSLRYMKPHIKSELSLVNSIIELKDFRSLPRTITHLFNFVRGLTTSVVKSIGKGGLGRLRRSFPRSYGPTLREALRLGADGYLQAKFNILPLLQDISGIQTALRKTSRRVNDMVSRQGRRRLKHFAYGWLNGLYAGGNGYQAYALNLEQLAGQTNPGGDTGCYNANMQGCSVVRQVIIDRPTIFRAQVEYNYHFTQFQAENAQLLGLLDALGVQLNPAIIWNAIPWTFLVDWLIGVSRWLGNKRTLNLDPVVNISRYLWSYETHRRVRIGIATPASGDAFKAEVYMPDLWESTYRREPELPTLGNSLFGSELSDDELSLGAALAITRKWKPTRARYLR